MLCQRKCVQKLQRVLQLNKQEAKKIKPKKAKKDDEVYIYDEIMKAVNRMDDARANEIGGDACIVLSTESAENEKVI